MASLSFCSVSLSASSSSWPWQSYRSSAATPPALAITKTGPTAPGYLFFDQNGPAAPQYSLFIMSDDDDDDDGELVWQSPGVGDYSAFRAQTLGGRPVLTFFNGISLPEPWGWGHGIVQILDDAYQSIYNVSLTADAEGYVTISDLDPDQLVSYVDMHEARITAEDTMLVTAYNVSRYDLRSIGGPEDGWIADCLFYEMDIRTNEVLFRWSALDHLDQIPLADALTFYPLADYGRNQSVPYGYFHINSVDKFQDGSYLISSRYYSSLFKVATNGSVEWTLQGDTGGDFALENGLSFSYQHDARILSESGSTIRISIFNNANSDVVSGVDQTTGIIMTVDTSTMTVRQDQLLLDDADPVYASSQGSLQVLPNGHSVMGYGSTSKIREYAPNGTAVMTAQFGPGDDNIFSYRAYRQPWIGRPKTAPAVFACGSDARNQTMVYMSWNGATEHREWKVFAGESEKNLELAALVSRKGFETTTKLPGRPQYVRVEARGDGIEAGVSDIVSSMSSC
ncbi:ASST-domain-containing protein [Xylariomycetidae sp. FL0641]|nr:ASST-domain-containing protein [Xylariomycetidae sp. FL0641]